MARHRLMPSEMDSWDREMCLVKYQSHRNAGNSALASSLLHPERILKILECHSRQMSRMPWVLFGPEGQGRWWTTWSVFQFMRGRRHTDRLHIFIHNVTLSFCC